MKAAEVAVRLAASPLGAVVVLAGLGYVAWRLVLKDKAQAVGRALDVTSSTNLASRAASSVVGTVTGTDSVGASIFNGVEAVRDLFGFGAEVNLNASTTDLARQVNNLSPSVSNPDGIAGGLRRPGG